MAHQSKGKKNRKVGRNAIGCKNYALSKRREHNKIVKLRRHLRRFPDDVGAKGTVRRMNDIIRG